MIFVTGGAGFIGSNFIIDWIAQGNGPVVNIDKLTYAGNPHNLDAVAERAPQQYHFAKADIGDRETMAQLLDRHQPWAVVNFAAESHVDRSISGPESFIQTNVVGTLHLLQSVTQYYDALPSEARTRFRFVHVSTDEVYGSLGPEDPPFSEQTPYAPNSPYSASKAASDHLVRAYHHTYGLPVLTTNCSNNYGPYQYPEKLIPVVIRNAQQGKPLPVYGDGSNVRDWLYVADHCAALRTVLFRGRIGQTYNIGGKCEKSNLEIVRAICQLLDELCPSAATPHESLIRFVTDRPGHDRRYAIDTRKIESELQWQPTESFDSGLRKTVTWYLSNPNWP